MYDFQSYTEIISNLFSRVGTPVVSYRRVYSDAGIYTAIRHQFSVSAQAPILLSRISMVQVHQGVEVEVISEVVDLPDIPPGDELSGADAYDDLEDGPFESRASTAGGRHSLAGAPGVLYQICLPSLPKEKRG